MGVPSAVLLCVCPSCTCTVHQQRQEELEEERPGSGGAGHGSKEAAAAARNSASARRRRWRWHRPPPRRSAPLPLGWKQQAANPAEPCPGPGRAAAGPAAGPAAHSTGAACWQLHVSRRSRPSLLCAAARRGMIACVLSLLPRGVRTAFSWVSLTLCRPVGPEGHRPQDDRNWPHAVHEDPGPPFQERLPRGWVRSAGSRRKHLAGHRASSPTCITPRVHACVCAHPSASTATADALGGRQAAWACACWGAVRAATRLHACMHACRQPCVCAPTTNLPADAWAK